MSVRTSPTCFIVPVSVLKKLREEVRDPAQGDALDSTILLSARLRGERDYHARHMLPHLLGLRVGPPGGLERRVFNARHKRRLPGDLVRAEGAPPVPDEAVDQAYDNVGITYRFYAEVFDRNSVDGHGLRLDSSVHFGRLFDNAFWNGMQMVYGDGNVLHGFTAALDVIAHELTHGVTQYTVPGGGLVYEDQSGALNESVSDVFGIMTKQWHLGQTVDQADWLIGADLFPAGSGQTLRSMKDPSQGYVPQPSKMSEYVDLPDDELHDNGGVHLNSGIPNHAFYLAATALGGQSWTKAGQIWYRALQRLQSTSDFKAAANATVEAASALYGASGAEAKAVANAWRAVEVIA